MSERRLEQTELSFQSFTEISLKLMGINSKVMFSLLGSAMGGGYESVQQHFYLAAISHRE